MEAAFVFVRAAHIGALVAMFGGQVFAIWVAREGGRPRGGRQWDPYAGLSRSSGRWLARADLAWPSRRLLVELDGYNTHGTPIALQKDLRRQNNLVAAGWTVLRFTWNDRRTIVNAVRQALID